MSSQQLSVTLSATDTMSPTIKQIIASMTQLDAQLKQLDAGLVGFEGKVRTTGASMQAALSPNTLGVTGLRQFSAGLNQVGIDFTNVGTQVTGASSKFAQFGQTLLANGTAFGVAGASAFGLFNAIDNLEKVQLRASTAATRASAANTALATAELALTKAKTSGVASSEQLAVLEARVADARLRVADTSERAAIFQQDYNEALAGLALQIGPQAIALGGSLVQVYSTLSQTLSKGAGDVGGFTNALAGFLPGMTKSTTEITKLDGALGNMSITTKTAGSSMKSMIAEFGPLGIALAAATAAVIAFGEAWAVAAAQIEENKAKIAAGEPIDIMKTLGAVEKVTQTQGFLPLITGLQGQIEDAKRLVSEAITGGEIQQALLDAWNKEMSGPEMQLIGQLPPDVQSKITDNFNRMLDFIVNDPNFATNADQAFTLNILKPLSDSWEKAKAELPKLLFPAGGGEGVDISGWLTNTFSKQTEAAGQIASKFFDVVSTGKVPVKELSTEIAVMTQEFVKANPEFAGAEQELARLATDMITKMVPAVTASVDSLKLHENQARLVAAGYIGMEAAQSASVASLDAFNANITTGIVALQQQAQALLSTQIANETANAVTMEAITLAGAEVIAMTDLGAIYDGSATSFLALTAAKVAGVTAAADFITQTELEATTVAATTAALLEYITVTEGIIIPPGIEATLPLLQAMQKEIQATGAAAKTLADAMNAELAPAFSTFAGALGARSWKDFKEEFEKIEFGDVGSKFESEIKKITNAMRPLQETSAEATNVLNGLVLGFEQLSEKAKGQAVADIVKQIEDLVKTAQGGEQLQVILDWINALPEEDRAAGIVKIQDTLRMLFGTVTDEGTPAFSTLQEGKLVLTEFAQDLGLDKATAEIDAMIASLGELGTAWNTIIQMAKPGQTLSFGTPGSSGAVPLGTAPGEEGGPVVHPPTKDPNFDAEKQKIIDEITKMWDTTVIPPAVIPPPDDTVFTPAMTTIPTTATTTFVSTFNAGFGGGAEGGGSGLVIPAPNPQAFIIGMAGVVVTAVQTAALVNAAFETALVVPAPNTDAFTSAMNTLLLIPADFTSRFNSAFTALVIPAPNTDAFTEAMNTLLLIPQDFIQRWNDAFAEGLIMPAPDLTEFADGLVEALEMVAEFTVGAAELILLIPEAFIPIAEAAELVFTFVEETGVTAFENLGEAGTTAGEDIASAMDDAGAAAADAESEVQSLISALESIPTDIQVTITVTATGNGLQFLAGGYHGIVNEPTLFVVGEAGPERVDVEPAAGNINPMFAESGMSGQPYGLETLIQSRIPDNIPPPYSPPPAIAPTAAVGPIIQNITVPVYLDGRHIETRTTRKVIRDLGALVTG